MKKIAISIITASFLIISCNNASTEKATEKTETVTHEEDHHHGESEEIELNNGEKWKVNEDMMIHVRAIEKEVAAFSTLNNKDYKAEAGKIQKHLDLLTANCTMTGQAHDELHKWLVPFLDMVSDLTEGQYTEEEAAKKFAIIESSFITFNQYFQ